MRVIDGGWCFSYIATPTYIAMWLDCVFLDIFFLSWNPFPF